MGTCVLLLSVTTFLVVVNCGRISETGSGEIYKHRIQERSLKHKLKAKNAYISTIKQEKVSRHDLSTCNVSSQLVEEIKNYTTIANKIIDYATKGTFKGRTLANLSKFVDFFGPRVSGSEALEKSIDYIIDIMNNTYKLANVHGEKVMVPHHFRGEEKAELIEPRQQSFDIMGLVPLVGTGPDGIEAEVLVVRSFEELEKKEMIAKAKGKIIVFNQGWLGSYDATVDYRNKGASAAAKAGGVAALIESVGPFSINTVHTGDQTYEPGVRRIPAASISTEMAEMLYRLQYQEELPVGKKLVIKLKMVGHSLPDVTSRNVFGEIRGREKPDEIVGISGHIDSWDVGTGAIDDAGGVFISVEALALLQELGLPAPRRTLRAILWTAEEVGLIGAADYVKKHEAELEKFSAIFESDSGTFKPLGLDFAGSEEAGCIVNEVLKLLAPINATTYSKQSTVDSDISLLIAKGVPGLSLNNKNEHYFWFHHTQSDTVTHQDSVEMDLCTAVWAVTSYVIADLSIALPRNATSKTA